METGASTPIVTNCCSATQALSASSRGFDSPNLSSSLQFCLIAVCAIPSPQRRYRYEISSSPRVVLATSFWIGTTLTVRSLLLRLRSSASTTRIPDLPIQVMRWLIFDWKPLKRGTAAASKWAPSKIICGRYSSESRIDCPRSVNLVPRHPSSVNRRLPATPNMRTGASSRRLAK